MIESVASPDPISAVLEYGGPAALVIAFLFWLRRDLTAVLELVRQIGKRQDDILEELHEMQSDSNRP